MKRALILTVLLFLGFSSLSVTSASAASPNDVGLLRGKTLNVLNSSGTQLATTDVVTDGVASTYIEFPKVTSTSQSVLSYTFDEPQSITAFKLSALSYRSGTSDIPYITVGFYDSSNVLVAEIARPSFYGSLQILNVAAENITKITLKNTHTTNPTRIFEFDLFNKTFESPQYLGGLLDNNFMNIISPVYPNMTTTNVITDGSLSTGMTFGKSGTTNTGVYLDFPTSATVNKYQISANVSKYDASHPAYNFSALSLEFYGEDGSLLSSIYMPSSSGHVIELASPVSGVTRIKLSSGTALGTTVVNDFNVFGFFEEPEVPVEPSFERALLTIYISGGQIKEYDLSAAELNAFLSWYDAKDAGSGPAKYKFVKTWNKGPFKTRTEYVIFDKILTFDVDEYEVENP
ncbi:hypothetical protein [Cohnella boryungensis]|uniref:Uncharacterized protein n=1 Tax=Cohnella boryungensis TaxID=768479 RepID=A0ABV8SG39_9BACL